MTETLATTCSTTTHKIFYMEKVFWRSSYHTELRDDQVLFAIASTRGREGGKNSKEFKIAPSNKIVGLIALFSPYQYLKIEA